MSDKPDIPNLASMLSQLGGVGNNTISEFAEENPELIGEISQYGAIQSVEIFAAILCDPDFQGNCLRLEWMVHLCLTFGSGKRKPSRKKVARWFRQVGSAFSFLEDPAEDVFVSHIISPFGNFRMLTGIWEFGDFHVQRILNALIKFGSNDMQDDMLIPIIGLLKLSDAVCERFKLSRFQLGEALGQNHVTERAANKARRNSLKLRFSLADLESYGIYPETLTPFGFDPRNQAHLADESVGHTVLERFPLTVHKDDYVILLPTAVSVAIRRFVFERFQAQSIPKGLSKFLMNEYQSFLRDTPFFGGKRNTPFQFGKVENVLAAAATADIDSGRFLQLIAIVDDLEGFEENGFVGSHPNPGAVADAIEEIVRDAYDHVKDTPNFKGLVSAITVFGFGRMVAFGLNRLDLENWRPQFISPAHYEAISQANDFSPLQFWRIIDAEDDMGSQNVSVQNINGFLNLTAWIDQNDGHIIPPNSLGDTYDGGPLFLNFDSNALRAYRHKLLTTNDEHFVKFINGSFLHVRHFSGGDFEEDQKIPIYASMDWDEVHGLKIVYKSSFRNWWGGVSFSNDVPSHMRVQKWEMLRTWLVRIAPVMEERIPPDRKNSLFVECVFEGEMELMNTPQVKDVSELPACFSYNISQRKQTITVNISSGFELFLYHPENVAERELVSTIVSALFEFFELEHTPKMIKEIVSEIVPNAMARQAHAFEIRGFRDHFAHQLPKRLPDNKIDEARAMAHLGWKVRARSEGNKIEGRRECTQYLNKTCQHVLTELCTELQKFERGAFLKKCILNYEAAMVDRLRWRRTAGAVINLRKDKVAAEAVISQNEHELNRLFNGLRVLMEMAVSECPADNGIKCGDIDLSRLVSKAMSVVVIGGFSDTIHWGAVPPEVQISAFGEIQIDFTFYHQVMEPYVFSGTELTIKDEIEKYKSHTQTQSPALPFADVFEAEFVEAIRDQFGFSVEELRAFVEEIENEGVRKNSHLLELKESEVQKLCFDIELLSKDTVCNILKKLSLWPRGSWNSVPEGFASTDTHPWRFRRQLSILRRPIFKIDNDCDPAYLISPGMLREAFYYQIRNYHDGSFPKRQLKPGKMRKWKALVDGRAGDELENDVLQKVTGLGWKALKGIKLTEIFGKKLERDFGEIDVLAWSEEHGQVIIIECKDVKYKKTPGEIAEQLSDFLGVEDDKGKPDLLLKHLRRVQKLRDHSNQLANFLKLPGAPKIEALLLFRNPVPMMFAWENVTSESAISTLANFESFLINGSG